MTTNDPHARKVCKACRVTKPQTKFYMHPTSGAYARCKACMVAARKAAYRADPGPTKAAAALSKARRKAQENKP